MSEERGADRLDSWKDIAAYLKRDVSTVQRWEKREGMPVHRHVHDKLGSVYAYPAELDAWQQQRRTAATEAAPPQMPAVRGSRAVVWLAVALLAIAAIATAIFWWFGTPDNPLANARFVPLTDFEGVEHSAAISRDGKFAAIIADRDGGDDVWITEIGSGQFRNLTNGRFRQLVNRDVRTLGFSADGKLVTFWVRTATASKSPDISVWSVPVSGGQPGVYLRGMAEFDWSRDGKRVVDHTAGPGDPMFVNGREIFTSPSGLHSHFPVWSPDDAFIYFVHGSVPNAMDIWRIRPSGGVPERMTSHDSRVTYPTFLDKRTLLYLATDARGRGPWLYALDLRRKTLRCISSGVERYTSISASADGRRLIATMSNPKRTFWKMPITGAPPNNAAVTRVPIPNAGARDLRIGPDYLAYVASGGEGEGISKLVNSQVVNLWSDPGARILGAPAISPDGGRIAFTAEERGRSRVHVMNSDGSAAHVLRESLDARGAPAWSPDGRSIAVPATVNGVASLVSVSADGRTLVPLTSEFANDPAWTSDGASILYSGPDVGTTFQLRLVSADGHVESEPNIMLSRGARRFAFLPGKKEVIVLRGDINRKNFSVIDLDSGRERQLTNFGPNFLGGDFDVSRDGREIIFDREQQNSDIVLIER